MSDAYSTFLANELIKPAPPITEQALFEMYTHGIISEENYNKSLKSIKKEESQ